ncbi:diguanylate cyclase (GGDEF) domain-containing protein [Ruminococcaceae bacterium YRB3002]|nr:diguanylate cyclase (GGDEF) domain-containing protein [Ruminococcaceae bacterium YRB3002]
MTVNKLNQLYKPDRLLYYIDASDEDLTRFPEGVIPDEINRYANAFGTYDYPGVFLIKSLDKPVIGIEFRIGDDRVSYPEGLSHIRLSGSYFFSVEMDDEIDISREAIADMFMRAAGGRAAHRLYSDLSIGDGSDVISVFSYSKKMRILYECTLNDDIARDIISGDPDRFDKGLLYEMAFTEPLTRHYNWNHLVAILELPADSGIRDYAFVHFDIKEFRVINEVYGHNTGNDVLRNVVKAMNEADFVYASARCHNDNFAMMIRDMPEDETVRVLEEFFDSLSHLDEDPSYRIYFRCGVVPMQRTILSGNRVADAGKMAQALGVEQNKTEIIIYTDKMHDDITWGDLIKAYVDTAIARDEFHVFLQPKFDIRQEVIKGSEALIRWNYKSKEMLTPGRFIPFFEKDGSIGKIDDIVLEKVCKALVRWKEEGKPLYPVSVNLSRKRLYDPDIISHLVGIVDRYGVSHELIDFELTESATYDNKEYMLQVLESLREQGFKISMDDFGTGYSSLSLLTEMPLDTLKIDKSFVDKLGTENEREQDVIVIRLIIALARELGFLCLAEGAERKEQVDLLRSLGCDVIQGYYYSKPIPMDEFDRRYLKM